MGRTYRQSLAQPGAHAFLWTQFLGAFNDNIFKIVVSFMAMTALGPVDGVAFTGAVFILPFLLFSGYAGHLADVHSKRQVLVWTKVLEIVAMALAIPALLIGRVDAELPKLSSMKIDKKALRRDAWAVDGVHWRPDRQAALRVLTDDDRQALDHLLTGRAAP